MKVIARTTAYTPAISVNPSSLLSNRSPASHQVAVALQHLLLQYSFKNQSHTTLLRKEISI